MQPVITVIRPFCFHQKQIVSKGCLLLPWCYIYMYEIKQNIWSYKKMRQKGSFWNWFKIMGITKALKCCQNLYQVVVCPCPGAFSNDDPGLTLTIFMIGSNLFPDVSVWVTTYNWIIKCSCISKFVLIQHILSTQVSDTGPMVFFQIIQLHFPFKEEFGRFNVRGLSEKFVDILRKTERKHRLICLLRKMQNLLPVGIWLLIFHHWEGVTKFRKF